MVLNKNSDKFKTINKPCDKKADLFMLQHEHLSAEGFDAPPPAGSTIRLVSTTAMFVLYHEYIITLKSN